MTSNHDFEGKKFVVEGEIPTDQERTQIAKVHFQATGICHHDFFRNAGGYNSNIVCIVCGRRGTHQNDGNHGW